MRRFTSLLVAFACLIVTRTVAASQTKCDQDLARVTTAALEPRSFELDPTTIADLGLLDLTYPVLAKTFKTELGRARLRHLLTHPLLDSEAIVERQDAIKALIADDELRVNLREWLEYLEKTDASFLPMYMKELRERESNGRIAFSLTGLGTAGVLGGLTAAIHSRQSLLYAFPLLYPIIMLGQRNESAVGYVRGRIAPVKEVLEFANAVFDDLNVQSNEKLSNIAATFKIWPRSLDLFKLSDRLNRLISSPLLIGLGNYVYLTNGPTHLAREVVLEEQPGIEALLTAIAELDVLSGIAEFYVQNKDDYHFPTILPEDHPTVLEITEGHHPFVLDKVGRESISNSLSIGKEGENPNFLLLTGPNTGGKSTYLRMLTTNAVLAQIGAPVPAESMRLTPVSLMTNMNVQDALGEQQSFFKAQATRVKNILAVAAGQKHMFVIMDEILTGTSPEEHTAIERAIIKYQVKSNSVSILATHDRKLQSLEKEIHGVTNIHVAEKSKDVYKVRFGPSIHRNAIDVLREVGFPAEIIEDAENYLREILGQ